MTTTVRSGRRGRVMAVASLLVATALLATGCSSDGGDANGSSTATSPTTASPSNAPPSQRPPTTTSIPAQPNATSSPTPTPTPTAPVTATPALPKGPVNIALSVRGCRGCVVEAFSTRNGVTRSLGKRAVRAPIVTWRVDGRLTRGMAFTIRTGSGATGRTQTAVVIQYDGVRTGTIVSEATASRARSASFCWAGADDASELLPIRITRFTDPDTGRPALRAHASPSRRGVAPFTPTVRGALRIEGAPACAT